MGGGGWDYNNNNKHVFPMIRSDGPPIIFTYMDNFTLRD